MALPTFANGFTYTAPDWRDREIADLNRENRRLRAENQRLQGIMDGETDEHGVPTAGSWYVRALETIANQRRELHRLQDLLDERVYLE